MKYENYIGTVECDDDANLFHGEIANLCDVVTFQGWSVIELKRAFRESIEDYVEFCAKRGVEPERATESA
jgi:predicted HicB family RNase H-like nuclease